MFFKSPKKRSVQPQKVFHFPHSLTKKLLFEQSETISNQTCYIVTCKIQEQPLRSSKKHTLVYEYILDITTKNLQKYDKSLFGSNMIYELLYFFFYCVFYRSFALSYCGSYVMCRSYSIKHFIILLYVLIILGDKCPHSNTIAFFSFRAFTFTRAKCVKTNEGKKDWNAVVVQMKLLFTKQTTM